MKLNGKEVNPNGPILQYSGLQNSKLNKNNNKIVVVNGSKEKSSKDIDTPLAFKENKHFSVICILVVLIILLMLFVLVL